MEEVQFAVCGQSAEGQLQILVVAKADIQNWQRVAKKLGCLALNQCIQTIWHCRTKTGGSVLVGAMGFAWFAMVRSMALLQVHMVWSMIDALFKQDETLRASISVPETVLVPQQIMEIADVNNSELIGSFLSCPISVIF